MMDKDTYKRFCLRFLKQQRTFHLLNREWDAMSTRFTTIPELLDNAYRENNKGTFLAYLPWDSSSLKYAYWFIKTREFEMCYGRFKRAYHEWSQSKTPRNMARRIYRQYH